LNNVYADRLKSKDGNANGLSYTQHELYLATNNRDEVKTAWQYVYSHGCIGKQVP
jgi:hypothetical protein